uniref:Leucine-rich repeat-containing N-terminal plant-type domain-containing protein n=1 Tax=Brassica campestris TaxID=3711 RepID=M4CV90_BRACM
MERKVFFRKYLICVIVLLGRLHGYKSCVENERKALLELRKYIFSITKEEEFEPKEYYVLPSWTYDTKSDCCQWEGVICNQTSKRITEIAFGGLKLKENSLLNLSLLHPFEEVRSLNLSKSKFSFLYQFDEKGFDEETYNQFSGFFDDVEGYKSLGRLRNLKILDLSSNTFNNNLFPFLNAATSLTTLFLRDNYMDGPLHAKELSALMNLKALDLSDNEFTGSIELQGKFTLKGLLQVDLSNNKISGVFPSWLLDNNKELLVLRLQNNYLTSFQLPKSTHGLAFLDVSMNEFNHLFPDNIGLILPHLISMNISSNSFQGKLSSSLSNITMLSNMDLSHNSFQGEIHRDFLKGCYFVEILKLSHNRLSGEVFPEEVDFYGISELLMDNNQFTGKIGQGLLSLKSLVLLDISNNNLTGAIPSWIGQLPSLIALLLSNNSLEGEIPISLFNTSTLSLLDLSANMLSGDLPPHVRSSKPFVLLLQDNNLSGAIPDTLLMNVTVLDLRNNRLCGNIPEFISTQSIGVLLMRGNNLTGRIPRQLCGLRSIHFLDLANKKLNGSIPSCLSNTSLGLGNDNALYYFDFDFSERSSSFWGGYALEQDSTSTKGVGRYFNSLLVLDPFNGGFILQSTLTKIEFATKHRYDSYMGGNLELFFGMDLSKNELSGEIPFGLGNLHKLHALNLSHNKLSGVIPKSFSGLRNVESLDLSSNKLQGRIPSQLAQLSNLAVFNVSFNNLSGVIPQAS